MLSPAYAQPTVLGTDAFNYNTYSTYNLSTYGKLRSYRGLAANSALSGLAKWEFATGTAAATNYSTNWRPYFSSTAIPAFDSIIDPLLTAGSARWNTSFGGQSGFLPAIIAGRYYTFNIGDNGGANNYMAVWETNFNPATISSITQSPITICSSGSDVSVTINANQSLNAAEKGYLRYSSSATFTSSSLVQISFTGTSGTATIPNPGSGTIYYYVFTSKLALSQLAPSGVVNETYCDLSTLSMNNNSGANYSFTVVVGTVPSALSFTPTNACNGIATTFTASATNADLYDWNFGAGFIGLASGNTSIQTLSTGTISVTLRTKNNTSGCEKTLTQSVTVNPVPSTQTINPNTN